MSHTPSEPDSAAFLRTQLASARASLEEVSLTGLSLEQAQAVGNALRALRAGSPQPTPELDPDVGARAQAAAQKHLDACLEAMDAYEQGEEDVEDPAFGPYCGCETCTIREILYAAWPVLWEAAVAEMPRVESS